MQQSAFRLGWNKEGVSIDHHAKVDRAYDDPNAAPHAALGEATANSHVIAQDRPIDAIR